VIDVRNYTALETLRDGTPVTIRAIQRGDSDRILAAFNHLDRESVYTRFFTYKKGLNFRLYIPSPHRWLSILSYNQDQSDRGPHRFSPWIHASSRQALGACPRKLSPHTDIWTVPKSPGGTVRTLYWLAH
jgi:hypothetical protein